MTRYLDLSLHEAMTPMGTYSLKRPFAKKHFLVPLWILQFFWAILVVALSAYVLHPIDYDTTFTTGTHLSVILAVTHVESLGHI